LVSVDIFSLPRLSSWLPDPCGSGDRLARGDMRLHVHNLGGDPAADSPTATLLRLTPLAKPKFERLRRKRSHSDPTRVFDGGVCKEQDVFTAFC